MNGTPSEDLLRRHEKMHEEDADLVYAFAELHYTGFESFEQFKELCQRHGLKLTAEFPNEHMRWVWVAPDGLKLSSSKAPFDGEEGYLSYTHIRGPAGAAEHLFNDIAETAEYIKGEFQPLQTDDGEEIVSLWDVREKPNRSTKQEATKTKKEARLSKSPDKVECGACGYPMAYVRFEDAPGKALFNYECSYCDEEGTVEVRDANPGTKKGTFTHGAATVPDAEPRGGS